MSLASLSAQNSTTEEWILLDRKREGRHYVLTLPAKPLLVAVAEMMRKKNRPVKSQAYLSDDPDQKFFFLELQHIIHTQICT